MCDPFRWHTVFAMVPDGGYIPGAPDPEVSAKALERQIPTTYEELHGHGKATLSGGPSIARYPRPSRGKVAPMPVAAGVCCCSKSGTCLSCPPKKAREAAPTAGQMYYERGA